MVTALDLLLYRRPKAACDAIARLTGSKSLISRGRWAPILGCCRGCGAHLIWVTTIDAFSPKKSPLARKNLTYFTVLHISRDFGPNYSISGTFPPGFAKP